jgi:flagellar export protein FliJ
MKQHALLIRLYRNQVDEKRRDLADLERMHAALDAQIHALGREIEAEQQAATASGEAAMTYGAYAAQAVSRRDVLKQSLADIAQRIETANDAVLDAFRTLKKHEVARDLRERQNRKTADAREQDRLDEIALTAFRKQQSQG